MSETTSFNPSDEYINALLCKVAYEGVPAIAKIIPSTAIMEMMFLSAVKATILLREEMVTISISGIRMMVLITSVMLLELMLFSLAKE